MLIGIIIGVSIIGFTGIVLSFVWFKNVNENVKRINSLISKYRLKFENEGVSSIEKWDEIKDMIPKNEILYSCFNSFITRVKDSQEVDEGFGLTLVSDKAITIECKKLVSGKRRYLYKNIKNTWPSPVRKTSGNGISFKYNNKTIRVYTNDFEKLIMAFHLLNNPIKTENSISF